MDIYAYLTPWNLGGSVAGLVLGVGTLVSLIWNRRQIGTALIRMSTRLFSQIGFFSLVIVVFMVISVLESGDFFNRNITHNAVFGFLGYALALGFDLVSILCMLARLNAERMRDERGSRLNLIGVIICAVVSAFANACGSLQGFTPITLNHTPLWMQALAPWLSMVFPTMIVILSMTTDHILDHAPANGVDVATFRAREQKRVDMLHVRLDTEKALLTLEAELGTLRYQREQASGRVQREWLFWRWLRPVVPVHANTLGTELQETMDQRLQTLTTAFEERFEQLHTSVRTLDTQVNTWTTAMNRQADTLRTQMDHLQSHVDTLDIPHLGTTATMEPDAQVGQGTSSAQETSVGQGHTHVSENQDRAIGRGTGTADQGDTARRILAAFQRIGINTPDTQIAREVGCSRKTVARWRKRLQEQGLLSVVAQSEEPSPLLKRQ